MSKVPLYALPAPFEWVQPVEKWQPPLHVSGGMRPLAHDIDGEPLDTTFMVMTLTINLTIILTINLTINFMI